MRHNDLECRSKRTGEKDPVAAWHVRKDLMDKVPPVMVGTLEYGVASTWYDAYEWRVAHKSNKNWGKDPRDTKKAKPKSKQRQKRPKARFDSTKGYPGEGPARGRGRGRGGARGPGGRKCHLCNKPGHLAAACKQPLVGRVRRPPRPVVEPQAMPRDVEAMPVAAALAIAEAPENEGAADAEEEAELQEFMPNARVENGQLPIVDAIAPGAVVAPAVLAPGPVEEDVKLAAVQDAAAEAVLAAAAEDARKLASRLSLIRNLETKAATMWLTKDLMSAEDRMVVVRSTIALIRSSDAHDVFDDEMSLLTMNMVDASLRRSLDSRTVSAARVAVDPNSGGYTLPQLVAKLFFTRPDTVKKRKKREWWLGPAERLAQAEKTPPFSILDTDTPVGGLAEKVVFGLDLAWCTAAVCAEETIKRFNPESAYWCFARMASLYSTVPLRVGELLHPTLAKYLPWVMCATSPLCTSIAITGLESWARRESPWGTVARFTGHYALSRMPFWYAVPLHVGWNMLCRELFPNAALDLFARWKPQVEGSVCLADHKVPVAKTQGPPCFECKYGDPVCVPSFGTRNFWSVDTVQPTVFRQCMCNEVVSICGRVGKDHAALQAPSKEMWSYIIPTMSRYICGLVSRVKTPLNFDAWVSGFPPAKRAMFVNMRKGIVEKPSKVASSFIKVEKSNKMRLDPEFKDPRWIQGCPVELTYLVGRWVRKLAKNVCHDMRPRHWDATDILGGRQISYTCGLTNEEIGDTYGCGLSLIESMLAPGENLVVVEDDQSRFDMHMTEGPFALLNRVYYALFPKHVAALLKRGARHKCKGRSRLGTKYKIDHTMQSGWPDTSLGDTLVNVAMKAHIHGVGRKWFSIICADDSITITTDRELARLGGSASLVRKYFDFGMEVKVVVRKDPLDVEFCSGRFMACGETYNLVPATGKLLARLCCDMVDRPKRHWQPWLRGIGTTLEKFGTSDPILGALGHSITKFCGPGNAIMEVYNPWKIHYVGERKTTLAEQLSFYDRHYMLSYADVKAIVQCLSKSFVVGHVETHPLVVQMAQVDL